MQNFRNLKVWQKAHALAKDTYKLSATLKQPTAFRLKDQLVKSALSVPANLAEGCGRIGDRELRRFVRIALGSASELEYYLLFARDLGFLPGPTYERLDEATTEVKRMLVGLASQLTASLSQQNVEAES
jgi:four helix bundle protein